MNRGTAGEGNRGEGNRGGHSTLASRDFRISLLGTIDIQ